jgi:hypothetical protein
MINEPCLTTGCAAGVTPLTAPLLAIRPAKCLTVNQSRRPSCGPTRPSGIADPTASTSPSMHVRPANPQRVYGRAKQRGWASCSVPSASLDQVPATGASRVVVRGMRRVGSAVTILAEPPAVSVARGSRRPGATRNGDPPARRGFHHRSMTRAVLPADTHPPPGQAKTETARCRSPPVNPRPAPLASDLPSRGPVRNPPAPARAAGRAAALPRLRLRSGTCSDAPRSRPDKDLRQSLSSQLRSTFYCRRADQARTVSNPPVESQGLA